MCSNLRAVASGEVRSYWITWTTDGEVRRVGLQVGRFIETRPRAGRFVETCIS